jgi:hypothetical protein
LLKIFRLDEGLEVVDTEQVSRVHNKMDLILSNPKFRETCLPHKHTVMINNVAKKFDWVLFVKTSGAQFLTVASLSLASFIYVNYFTEFFERTRSVRLFKPLFVGAFIITPPFLSLYFLYLDMQRVGDFKVKN